MKETGKEVIIIGHIDHGKTAEIIRTALELKDHVVVVENIDQFAPAPMPYTIAPRFDPPVIIKDGKTNRRERRANERKNKKK